MNEAIKENLIIQIMRKVFELNKLENLNLRLEIDNDSITLFDHTVEPYKFLKSKRYDVCFFRFKEQDLKDLFSQLQELEVKLW